MSDRRKVSPFLRAFLATVAVLGAVALSFSAREPARPDAVAAGPISADVPGATPEVDVALFAVG